MPAPRHFFGIDFGTSSCSVSYVVDDPRLRGQRILQTISVQFDRDGEASTRMPSIVAGDLDDVGEGARPRACVGWQFVTQLSQQRWTPGLLRRGRDYFTSIKSGLGQFRVYPHSRIDGVTSPTEATRRVFEELIAATHRFRTELNIRESHVVITVPASASALARKDLIDAAVAAGLDRTKVELLDEPVAALVDLLNSPDAGNTLSDEPLKFLVFDFGAGTCDLALVQAQFSEGKDTGIEAQVLAVSPYERLGGDDIDRALVAQLVTQAFPDPQSLAGFSDVDRRALEDTLVSAVAQPLKEKVCREIEAFLAANPSDGWARLRSEPIIVQHSLARGFRGIRPGTRFTLSSEAFERIMAPFVEWPLDSWDRRSLMSPVVAILERARLHAQSLDVLVLHGGSSRSPYVQRLLRERLASDDSLFRARITTTPDMLTSVANGAAITCYWRHCRGQEFVVPVLGEDLGIFTSNGEHHELLRSSTSLPHPRDPDALADPFEGSARFFTPETNVSHVLVPFFASGVFARRMAGSVRIPIPPGTPPRSPIRIKLRIDRDKIVDWYTSMNGGPFVKQQTLDDPWTCDTNSAAARDLVDHRRLMASSVVHGRLSRHLLREEARYLWLAQRYREALECIDDALEECCRDDASSWNMRGLVLDDLPHRRADALEAYRRATELAPERAAFWHNLGTALATASRDPEAEAALRHSLSLAPGSASAHEKLGDICRRRGDEPAARVEFEQALALAERAVEARPFSRVDWGNVVRLRHGLGRYGEATAAGVVFGHLLDEEIIDGSRAEWIRGCDEEDG